MHSGGFSKEGAQKTTGTQQKVAPGVHFPFSIKNLNEVVSKESDGRLTVKTVRVEKCIIIGRITHIEEQRQRWNLKIEDCTGHLVVMVHKMPNNDSPPKLNGIDFKSEPYVKIFMTFKKQGSEGVFVLDYITQITNFNLITNHILLCVQSLLSIDNDVPKTDSVPEENGESSGNLMKIENSAGYAQPATRIQYTFPSDATPKEKFKKVLEDFLRSSNEGTKERIARHVNENLPNTFQQSEITQFLNQMEDDGDLIVVLKNEVRFYELI